MNTGIDSGLLASLARQAKVPEHSIPLMTVFSGGNPLCIDEYLFFAKSGWLMAIGYPLDGVYDDGRFYSAFLAASRQTGAKQFFAIAPRLPEQISGHAVEVDRYYALSSYAPIPSSLRQPIKKTRNTLEFAESGNFTQAHRGLWAEFLHDHPMNERVRELYLKTPGALAASNGSLVLLDARTEDGNLAASLLLDLACDNFISYIIGAHSRKNYVPHATDALFAIMLEKARSHGKRYIHLGLGVNDGIRRFKLKWGALPTWHYQMAQWGNKTISTPVSTTRIFLDALGGPSGASKRQILAQMPDQRPFAMLWKVEKPGRLSWLAGTAHFFCHSFEDSFRSLFDRVDNVIFEGPLDQAFMAQVQEAGQNPPEELPSLRGILLDSEISRLERVITGPRGFWARQFGISSNVKIDVRHLLGCAPWYAFFTAWTTFLERLGWRESVDLEAWRIAKEMGKNVVAMENLEEQLESLCSLPVERVARFFRNCHSWKGRAAKNISAYLAGDLEGMMGSSAEFPTRTEHIVGRRDQRFRERMLPWLEKGGSAVFVGSAHLVNLRHMLREDGFTVTQQPFGIWPKSCLLWRKLRGKGEQIAW